MSGSVWEWIEDDYHGTYDCTAKPNASECQANSGQAPADGSPWIDEPRGAYRVMRGGSFDSYDFNVRARQRNRVDPSSNINTSGFRLARDVP